MNQTTLLKTYFRLASAFLFAHVLGKPKTRPNLRRSLLSWPGGWISMLLAISSSLPAADWRQFRGPHSNGVADEAEPARERAGDRARA